MKSERMCYVMCHRIVLGKREMLFGWMSVNELGESENGEERRDRQRNECIK